MKVSPGYLICDGCAGYYQLQHDESPEDFSDVCECGGKLRYLESYDNGVEENGEFWRALVSGVFFGFILFFGLKLVVASLVGGATTAYMVGGGYRDGALNGFITGVIIMLLVMVVAFFYGIFIRNLVLDFSAVFSYGFVLVILFTVGISLAAGAVAAVGGLIGIKIRRIREKYQ